MKQRKSYAKPTVARIALRVEEPVLAQCLQDEFDPGSCSNNES